MSKALYRKYRSKSLNEVIGQKHVTDILSRAIAQGRVSHAYLLTGPRGVGKTSVARILAHEINGLKYDEDNINLDIIEIDAASNNGVEDVRDLREKVQIAPVSASKKIYIIDEVHMLSKAAFNALLKTLEEPPEHVVFILATTNVEKLPATIISRTQRFSFRPITVDDAINHLAHIAQQESINVTNDALRLIAQRSDGSFRDSISLLDQLSSLVGSNDETMITAELIEDTLGLTSIDVINQLIEAVESKDLGKVVEILTNTLNSGINTITLVTQLTTVISNEIVNKPQLLPLLDALIDVAKSPQPQLKLLSVLGMAAAPKQPPKSAALAVPIHEISASIAELEKQATRNQPIEPLNHNVAVTDTAPIEKSTITNPLIDTSDSASDVTLIEDTLEPKSDQAPGPLSDLERSSVFNESASEANKQPSIKKIGQKTPNSESFDWSGLVEYTRQNYIALYSVLSKCSYELDGDNLTLYTGNKFYKKKLDDTKYSPLLAKCLQEIGIYGLNIHTIPTTVPLKDDQAAAIAAIMGGGVEVILDPV